jgi:hypothetical protein
MSDLAFDRQNPDTGANSLNAKLEECRPGINNPDYVLVPTGMDYVACRKAGEAFINNILSLPQLEQRRHLERGQQVNDASVKDNYNFPQLNIVFSKSSEKLSDVKLTVPEFRKAFSFDLFDP